MQFTVRQIAQLLNGTVQGDDTAFIFNLGKIETAQAGDISFLSNPKYETFLYTTHASVVIVDKTFVPKKSYTCSLIFVENSYTAFTTLLEEYDKIMKFTKKGSEEPNFLGENSQVGEGYYRGAFSYIGANCKIGKNVKIYPQVSIGDNVQIGDNTILYAGVKIHQDCRIGNHCVIHANAVIGSDGFGFAPQADGSYKTIPQIGNVVIEDNVSVGANTTIDRATMGSTIIKQGVKLDNLVQIAHNVIIDQNTVIAAQTGISGSTKIGKNCMIGGQVGFAGHIEVADGTKVGAQAGVTKSVKKPQQSLNGTPAYSLKDYLRSKAIEKKLPEIDKQLSYLASKK